jgi:hypothetical protein
MITGQTAFLIMVVVAMLSLPLTLLWVVIYTNLGDRQDRKVAALAKASEPAPLTPVPRHASR